MRDTIDMAREAGFHVMTDPLFGNAWLAQHHEDNFYKFADLVRADEAEKYKWDVHSCGPTCEKVACVAMREAVQSEREACANECDELAGILACHDDRDGADICVSLRDTIRARGETK